MAPGGDLEHDRGPVSPDPERDIRCQRPNSACASTPCAGECHGHTAESGATRPSIQDQGPAGLPDSMALPIELRAPALLPDPSSHRPGTHSCDVAICAPTWLEFTNGRGGSSAGRALRSQCRGREFDPPPLHHDNIQGDPGKTGFLLTSRGIRSFLFHRWPPQPIEPTNGS
jgi:hypothetical protein